MGECTLPTPEEGSYHWVQLHYTNDRIVLHIQCENIAEQCTFTAMKKNDAVNKSAIAAFETSFLCKLKELWVIGRII